MTIEKRILVITTGGTIAGNVAYKEGHQAEVNHIEDFTGRIDSTVKAIQQKWNIDLKIDSTKLCDVDSSDIIPEHWSGLADIIKSKYDEYDSFLITHGTNTLGYTCAALSFAFENINKPIILTGSQVPFNNPGSDALMNLDNAIRVSLWPHDTIKGVLAVFGSHIIAGPRVKKSTEFDYDAFQSFTSASIGRIGRIITINKQNLLKHNSYLSSETNREIDPDSLPALNSKDLIVRNKFDMRIASITEFPGMCPQLFHDIVDTGNIKGVILRAFGAGDPSTNLKSGFEYLKKNKIPIIVTTQAPKGNSNFLVNEPGQMLKKSKLAVPSFDMSIEAETTKLAWLLGQGFDYEVVNRMIVKDLRGEINPLPELLQ